MTKAMRKRRSSNDNQRELVLSVFADYADNDVDQLFEFLQHCKIDLSALSHSRQLPDLIAGHFYLAPGVYDIEALGQLWASFPPMAARIREIRAERARDHKGST